MPEERPIVLAVRGPGEQERRDTNDAPDHAGEDHSHQAAARTARQEELDQLAPGRIPAADDHRLEGEARQQVALKPG